ncbi:MAG TPA: hypothetical protein VK842_06135, partial [bacterium]|nr:hypothetical protein [bacterium]
MAALGRWSLAAGWLLCAASRGRAACVPVDTTFHLVDSAAAGATPAGFVMQASGTGASGFTPAQPVTASPAYWYSPPITAVYDPGVYDLRVWTDGGAGPAEVTVQLGESNPDGSGYTALGSATQDVWAAGGNHATDFPITLPAVTLNNQVLRVTIVSAGGAQATMAFNGGTDFDSKLSTPGGVAAGCPTYTPVPCGFTTAAFTNGTTEKIDYLTPIGAAEPAGWDSNLGFNDAAWPGSVLWPGDGGHPPLAAGLSWSSYASGAASNGDDELLIRRVFNLPAGAINITGTLLLAVDDNSATTINGTAIQADAPSFVTNQVARSFPVAAGVLNPGANLLA